MTTQTAVKTLFAATYIHLESEEDHPEKGLIGGRECRFSERINVTASTMAGLIDRLCEIYGLDRPDSVFFSDGTFTIDQFEDAYGCRLSAAGQAAFMAGEKRAWIADYCFTIEKRSVSDVTEDDFIAESIVMH